MRRGILATREELRSLRDKVRRRPFDTIYDALRRRCALILETSPVTETQWRLSHQQGSDNAAMIAARAAQGRMLDLLVAHHVEPNAAYRGRAIEELKNLISWSSWSEPSGQGQVDLCTAEAGAGAVLALDWLWEDITEPDRLRVLRTVRNKCIEPYRQAVAAGAFWFEAAHHGSAVINSGCGLAALALADEELPAREAYRLARKGLGTFFNALGREGGWHEGLGYWGFAMRYLLLLAEATSRCLDDQGLIHSRGMDATGLFPVYFTPNGQSASFGDSPAVPLHGALYLLVKHFALRELTWWLDTYSFHRDPMTTGWSSAGLALLLRPADAETGKAPELMDLKVFHEVGWAAMADRWPRPGFYAALKCGDMSSGHSTNDMNSLQLQVDGEMLIAEPQGPVVARADEPRALAHNTLVVGQQDQRIDAQGLIVEAQGGRDYRWVAMDAGNACGPAVRFIRHVIMLLDGPSAQGQSLLVLDELTLPSAQRVDLAWHATAPMQFDPASMTGSITGAKCRLSVAMAATQTLAAQVRQDEATHGSPGRQGWTLSAGCGASGRLLVATAFGRKPVRLDVKSAANGSAALRIGGRTLAFKLAKRHLQLLSV